MPFNLKVVRTSSAVKVNKALESLARKEVYVGVPQANASRKDEPINNAELMYIHTNGSPIKHIPARPVIEPALEAEPTKALIKDELKLAAEAALSGDKVKEDTHLKRAGTIGSNAAKEWFTDPRNNWPKNRPSTIRNKLRKLRGKALKDALEILDEYENDSTVDASSIDTVLVDTGEMRRSITGVLGEK
jgi:hypothetical protein